MDDKTNLYVFEKKEVLLIFVFMILIAVTSFVLGVKIGKSFTYTEVERAVEESARVDMKSTQEEAVQQMMDAETPAKDYEEDVHSRIEEHIRREFEENEQRLAPPPSKENVEDPRANVLEQPLLQGEPLETVESTVPENSLRGKYTIQVGSHRSKNEAEQFANGFKVRGYDPIINEVEVPGRGIWYRVSIGIFESISDARDYAIKEQSLFQGEDYVFQRL